MSGGSAAATRTTDSGWVQSSTIVQAGQIAVAGINTAAAIVIANKQYEIAKGYLGLAKEMREYWNSTFKPREQAYVAEVFAEAKHTPEYAVQAGRYVVSVRQQFKKKTDDALRCVSRYCTGLSAQLLKDITLAEATALGNAANYAYRYAEGRAENLNDRRLSRQHNALGIGRDMLGQSAKYSQLASDSMGNLGRQAAAGAAGALQALGHDQRQAELKAEAQGRRDRESTAGRTGDFARADRANYSDSNTTSGDFARADRSSYAADFASGSADPLGDFINNGYSNNPGDGGSSGENSSQGA